LVAVAGMNAAIRVLVVDDDPLVRAGLAMILDGAPGLTLVGEAADGTEVAAAVEAHAPDVVLMDIRMPKLDGLAATELLRARPDPPEVIVLTTFHADKYVLRALRAGASGFLLKDTRPSEILRAPGSDTPGLCLPSSANANERSPWRSAGAAPTPRSATSCS
jgi:DNA-binding NarL/FixJ family response regulator